MDKNGLRVSQYALYKRAKTISDAIIKTDGVLSDFEYSLGWIVFNYLNNRRTFLKKRGMGLSVFYNTASFKKDYFISFGNIPHQITDKLESKKISQLKIQMNERGLGYANDKTLMFGRSFKGSGCKKSFTEDRVIDEIICSFVNQNLYDLQRLKQILSSLYRIRKPEFVLVDEDRTKFKQALIKSAIERGIKTFVIQHGLTPRARDNQMVFANESFLPVISDKFLCWGENSFNYMNEDGTDKSKFIVTGNASLKFRKNSMKKDMGILLIDQQFMSQEEERNEAYKSVIDKLTECKSDVNIYLRMDYNREYFKKFKGKVKLINWTREGIYDAIMRSETVLGFISTAMIESMYCGVPSISYDYLNRGDVMGFDSECLRVISDVELLSNSISEFKNKKLSSADYEMSIRKHISCEGEEAVKKIVDSIEDNL